MTRLREDHSRQFFLVGAALLLSLSAGYTRAQIDCDAGDTIQGALAPGALVEFVGTCDESVFIDGFDGVRLLGQGPGVSIIVQGLTVKSAGNVELENFAIDAGAGLGDGMFIRDGAQVTINNVEIRRMRQGLDLFRNSSALVDNLTVDVSDLTPEECPFCAVEVVEDSSLRMTNSTIIGNINDRTKGPVLQAFRDASIAMRGGNFIRNLGTSGALGAFFDSSVRQDNPFGHGTDLIVGGMDITGSAYVDVREVRVFGLILLDLHSVLRIGSVFFGGDPSLIVFRTNIRASRDSAIAVESPQVTIQGSITCSDEESSLSGTFQGGATVNCSGF